jgi:hypothetical protein
MAVVCDIYKSCVIFNGEVKGLKVTAHIMKSKYCTDNFSRCICYKHCQDQIHISEKPYYSASEVNYLKTK